MTEFRLFFGEITLANAHPKLKSLKYSYNSKGLLIKRNRFQIENHSYSKEKNSPSPLSSHNHSPQINIPPPPTSLTPSNHSTRNHEMQNFKLPERYISITYPNNQIAQPYQRIEKHTIKLRKKFLFYIFGEFFSSINFTHQVWYNYVRGQIRQISSTGGLVIVKLLTL